MLDEVAPGLFTLGYFTPPWMEYKSYEAEREAHWTCFLHEHLNLIGYRHRLPFQLGDFKSSDIRTAEWHRVEFNGAVERSDIADIQRWHNDYNPGEAKTPGTFAYECWLIVWANVKPTEVQMADGSVFAGEPYQLVAFQNGRYKHRTPRMNPTEAGRRWFARAYMNPWVPSGYRIRKDQWGDREIVPNTIRPADLLASYNP